MQTPSIIPNDHIAGRPVLLHDIIGRNRIGPQFIEQGLALFQRQTGNVRPLPTTKIQAGITRFVVCSNDRVNSTRCVSRIIKRLKAWS